MPILFVKDNIHHFKKMNYCLLPAAVGQLHRLHSHTPPYATLPLPFLWAATSGVYHYPGRSIIAEARTTEPYTEQILIAILFNH